MKANFLLLLMIHIGSMCFSQHALEVNFNKVYIGRNFSVNYKYEINKISLHAGLLFHVNKLPVPEGSFIKNGAHASKFHQHFGLLLKFDYKIYQNDFAEFGFYYSNQLNLIDQKIRLYRAVAQVVPIPQSEMDYLYIIHKNTYGPVFGTDNLIGLFLRANLNDVFYVSTYFGAGFLFWKSLDDNILLLGGKKPNQGIDLSSQFSLGFGYKIGKKQP